MEIFVDGVNRIRKIKGLTQAQLADKIPGGNRGTISSWLRGRTKLPEERMNDLSIALNTPMEEILKIGREEQSRKKEDPQKNQTGIKFLLSKEALLSALEEIMFTGCISRTEIEEFKQKSIDKESKLPGQGKPGQGGDIMIINDKIKSQSTKIPTELLLDETISDKARGLLVRMLPMPEDHKFNIQELINEGKNGNTSVRSAIRELEAHNYVHRFLIRENGRIVRLEYLVCDKPTPSDEAKAYFKSITGMEV